MRCFTFFSCLLGALIALSGVPSAIAQQHERGEADKHRTQSPHGGHRNADGATDLSSLLRQEGGRSPAHHGRERLSPEELRQIRRDINDAGRDIYRRDRSDRVN